MNQASIFRPEEELTITIYVDGRRIAYLSPSRHSARYRVQQVSTMVSDDRGEKVEGQLIFTRLVSLTPLNPTQTLYIANCSKRPTTKMMSLLT